MSETGSEFTPTEIESQKNTTIPESNHSKSEKFGYLREQYTPHRQTAHETLSASGLDEDSPEFRKARKSVARKYMELAEKGEVDQLTGLLNRQGFQRRLPQEVARSQRQGGKTSALYIDLNNVKVLNDSEGHDAGDELITSVAEIIQGQARPYDVVARMGGDEFVVILSNADQEQAKEYWNRINSAFQEKQIRPGMHISAAAGLAEIDPREVPESLRLADAAMYKAKKLSKEKGENTLQTASDLTNEEILGDTNG